MGSLFRNALEPYGLWALMALLPLAVLALYFLKLKREPVEVPSTYLWQKSIEDLHVNSLWQKLRQSLLLFLQLLLLLLAILALLRPGWEGDRLQGQRIIFAIDNSASMGTADLADAEHRLAEAKQHVTNLVEQMDGDMQAMVVSFNDEARVVQGFTDNRRKLREAVDKVQLTARTTNLLGALQLADGLANPGQVIEAESNVAIDLGEGEKTTLYIFSDGRFADVKGFSLGNLEPRIYVPLGKSETGNLALTAFSTRRNENRPDERQAFVQVSNFSGAAHTVQVDVSHDGRFLEAQEVEVPAGESRGLTFSLRGVTAGELTAKIADSSLKAAGDTMTVDNAAYAAVNDFATGRVLLVTPGNKVLLAALSTDRISRYADLEVADPSVLGTKEHEELAQSGAFDLIIYDQCQPVKEMPRSNTFFIGALPLNWQTTQSSGTDDAAPATEEGASEAAEESPDVVEVDRVENPQIIDQAREHPLMGYVELGDFLIRASYVVAPPAGGSVLIDSTEGPLLSIAPREGFEDLVLGFEITIRRDGSEYVNSYWYQRFGFPTFLYNTLTYFVGQSQGALDRTNLPGRSLELRTKSLAPELTVTGPAGMKETVRRNTDGTYLFHNTDQPGYYEILDGDKVVNRFAVNLFDGQESNVRIDTQPDDNPDDNIESAASLQIGHVEVEAQGARPARKDLWRPLLLLAVGVLLFEWYIYNRRVYL